MSAVFTPRGFHVSRKGSINSNRVFIWSARTYVVGTYVRTYIHINVHTHTYTCTYAYIHTYIRTYIYTYNSLLRRASWSRGKKLVDNSNSLCIRTRMYVRTHVQYIYVRTYIHLVEPHMGFGVGSILVWHVHTNTIPTYVSFLYTLYETVVSHSEPTLTAGPLLTHFSDAGPL